MNRDSLSTTKSCADCGGLGTMNRGDLDSRCPRCERRSRIARSIRLALATLVVLLACGVGVYLTTGGVENHEIPPPPTQIQEMKLSLAPQQVLIGEPAQRGERPRPPREYLNSRTLKEGQVGEFDPDGFWRFVRFLPMSDTLAILSPAKGQGPTICVPIFSRQVTSSPSETTPEIKGLILRGKWRVANLIEVDGESLIGVMPELATSKMSAG